MAEELMVVLNRSDSCGLGFSILGTSGLPPIIYDIIENSPAAESGEVEAGDVILKVNETDVNRFSTKEDPVIKARIQKYLSSHHLEEDLTDFISRDRQHSPYDSGEMLPSPAAVDTLEVIHHTNGSCSHASCSELEALLPPPATLDRFEEEDRLAWEPLSGGDKFSRSRPPRFEAFMMTGDLILNLSRTQQSTGLLPKHQKKVDSLRCHHRNNHQHHHNSVPTSPNEAANHRSGKCASEPPVGSTSAGTSPVGLGKRETAPADPKAFGYHAVAGGFVRTSRSEDHLQFQKDSMSAVDIDIDEDVTSSLNTLLDTRPEDSGSSNNLDLHPPPDVMTASDRIVWTYNAPIPPSPGYNSSENSCSNGTTNSSNSSTDSPQRSLSPQSPTSVSSSVMSSNSSSRRVPLLSSGMAGDPSYLHQPNGDLSQSEAISNISSPDFQEEETLDILSSRDLMEISDPSDSDSTLLVSDRGPTVDKAKNNKHNNVNNNNKGHGDTAALEHRIVIQVKGPDKEGPPASPRGSRRGSRGGGSARDMDLLYATSGGVGQMKSPSSGVSSGNVTPELVGYQIGLEDRALSSTRHDYLMNFQELRESEDELMHMDDGRGAVSPPLSEEDSDLESLHSFHYSPKAVDLPSAVRLAKRLFALDGFKKSDVSRHLSKNNDFSRAVADEYLRYFEFHGDSLDVALRKFLKQFSLTGETQERERVLVHFSKRFLDCNPHTFNSQDAVHTLTCAIMLLNTDLHGQNIGRKMTGAEFIENLSELNDGDNFPREVLKQLYQAIKSYPLEWALDEEGDECTAQLALGKADTQLNVGGGGNPFLDVPNAAHAIEYKKGYVMRKSCVDSNGKKTPFGKRGWKMFYCTLRDMVLYLHKDEHGFRKSAMSDNVHNTIRIHHALATKAGDYSKKQHVFRLQTADQAEFLFQTSDSKELQSWIDTVNFVCASFSAQPLAGACGSQRKFQPPLLPCSHTKLGLREQLRDHEERVQRLECELEDHRKHPPERGAKSLNVQNYREKEAYLHYELKRYKTYAYLLRSRMALIPPTDQEVPTIGEMDDNGPIPSLVAPPVPDRRSPTTNRKKTINGK